ISDSLRVLVAHEVGHILGLKHNFASSLTSTIPASESVEAFRRYLIDDDIDSAAVVASSVMDYNSALDDILIGAMIRKINKHKSAFTYDHKMMGYLIAPKSDYVKSDLGPHC